MTDPILPDLERFAAAIPDGAKLAIPADYSGVAMAATAALIDRKARDLHLVCVPTSGMQADLLIGAGCGATVETSAVSLDEFGMAPRFQRAVTTGAVRILDATCPAIHAALQASEKGLPFMPIRGILGSDLLKVRTDWRVMDNPFDPGEPIVAVPAIRPDVALFHAALADREGNVWIGRRRELMTMAHASVAAFVTVERIQDASLLDDERLAAGTIPALYVGAVADARQGARPLGLWGHYGRNEAILAAYAQAARADDTFTGFLSAWLAGNRREVAA